MVVTSKTVKPRLHPRIVTLIDMIPLSGPWPAADRDQWINSALHDFNLVFGSADTDHRPYEPGLIEARALRRSVTKLEPPPFDGPRLGKKRIADQQLVIDLDSVAWRVFPDESAVRISVGEVGPGDMVWDFRPGEQGLDSVIWEGGSPDRVPPLSVLKG